MSENYESMFNKRTAPWHGLGISVETASASREALVQARLDWNVVQKPIETEDGIPIAGFKANLRDSDNRVLGIVSNRYQIVQNEKAFLFTDELLGEGVTYETAGSFQDGRRVWLLARLPQRYIISGDEVSPFIVVLNSHDGTGAVKAAMTPIRMTCQNVINLLLKNAKRYWSTNHVGDIGGKLEDARHTLLYADKYMAELGKEIDSLNRIKLSERQVCEYIDALFPLSANRTEQQMKNLMKMKEEVRIRYFDAPDLQHVGKNAYRFINAVSDFVTHSKPLKERTNYKENLFARTIDGNTLTDRAYEIVNAA